VQPRALDFDLGQVAWLTNMRVTPDEAVAALRGLGFGVEERPAETGEMTLRLEIPSWRADVEESADVVEEIARIVGYDRIPSTIPIGPLPAPNPDHWFDREERLRELLLGAGLSEVLSYPLISRPQMARLLRGTTPGEEALLGAPAAVAELPAGGDSGQAERHGRADERRQIEAVAERLPAIVLKNPLSSEMEALRLTLMSGLLGIVRENSKHEDTGRWFFELGRRYLPTPELAAGTGGAHERRTLGVALTGPLARDWLGEREADFYDLKGVAEVLLRALPVPGYRFVPASHPTFHPGRCALVQVRPLSTVDASDADGGGAALVAAEAEGWVPVGVLGEVHPEIAERFEVPARTYLMELDLERLYLAVPARALYEPIPRVPPAERDIAIVVGQEAPAGEIEAAHGAVVKALAERFGAELRAYRGFSTRRERRERRERRHALCSFALSCSPSPRRGEGRGEVHSGRNGAAMETDWEQQREQERRTHLHLRDKRVVTIGGGTGPFAVLSSLKHYPCQITAIVTMVDSGGSSRRLSDEFGQLPFGDLRQALVALSRKGALWREVFTFRFRQGNGQPNAHATGDEPQGDHPSESGARRRARVLAAQAGVSGHSLGNLILSALQDINEDNLLWAIEDAQDLLETAGQVLPVTLAHATLCAALSDGTVLRGETVIDTRGERHLADLASDAALPAEPPPAIPALPAIARVYLEPSAPACAEALRAIRRADVLVLGPGDLYTSILPNLLVEGVAEAIRASEAQTVYVCNLMTKHGETDGFRASDFVR
ncbi:MAG TPA: 2-phospho-L-lactate transferase CofD family protein, partial [Ktedonobacterales bacterium]